MTLLRSSKGMSLLGALVAMLVLAAMGASMATLVATNQVTRSLQYTADQSFSSAQSALEVVLGYIHSGANPCSYVDRDFDFAGSDINVNRANGRIYVTADNGGSNTAVSIVDPDPSNAGDTLLIDTGSAQDASNGAPPKKLIGVILQLDPGCGTAVTLTSMVVTWTPEYGEDVEQIKLDNLNIYNSSEGAESGELIDVTDTTINDAGEHPINFIRWGDTIQNRLYTIQFNFSDGSNKVVTVDTQ